MIDAMPYSWAQVVFSGEEVLDLMENLFVPPSLLSSLCSFLPLAYGPTLAYTPKNEITIVFKFHVPRSHIAHIQILLSPHPIKEIDLLQVKS